jgi:hypothetical protein
MWNNLVDAHRGGSSNAWVWTATSIVFVGAVFFGLASCGGYGWHKEAFRVSATVTAILAVVVPSPLLRTIVRKAMFLAALVIGFHFVEAAVAPFYPGPPESMSEYGTLFLQSLEFGPCR